MRFWLPLRRVRDMWRSSIRAAPRAVVCESDMVTDFNSSGELAGRLKLTDPGESGASCAARPGARRLATLRKTNTAVSFLAGIFASCFSLLHIYVIYRHVARFGIHVASPHGTIGAGRICHVFGANIHQSKGLAARPDLNSIFSGLYQRVFFAGNRRRASQRQPGYYHHYDTGERQGGARAGEQRRLAQGRLNRVDALAGREPQPDIRPHFRRQAVPRHFRDLGELGEDFANAGKRGYFVAAEVAIREMPFGIPPSPQSEVPA